MMDLLVEKVSDSRSWLALLVGVFTVASLLSVGLPLIEGDRLGDRMKLVASERERIRAREREKLLNRNTGKLRQTPKAFMKDIVDKYSLSKWLGTDEAKSQLAMAGYRGAQAEVGFLFFRLVTPIAAAVVSALYVFVLMHSNWSFITRLSVVICFAYGGLKGPEIYIANIIAKRQESMRLAFPDALDLLLICVESGMSVEQGFRRVSQEIGARSVPLAEEFALTTAELSYLPDRRQAYENFYKRTGLDGVKNISTSLIQAEKYGTPLGTALRVVSQESRDHRMMEAEKKAASLPPKLTVPMILFFLPVLFAVIMTPAVIQIMSHNY
ncbi:type II secretion system F family protein [Rhodoblastus acidophilus]|uniref:Type II secretion system F family protein n=1 Tax=Candidatus Rhodoblastus alkanivorans TaxID=2954117 RepID=A0ABS9ZAM6_9HYPH|nr:type II secretion system F family protein [Candidatus Rhodoblastus alkanivorans]MCI4677808.1 type II secretion system F family protein [Candidatus Rhodoblastus alkanivorans]MCI4684694.1 type II secretion system F family protein [Candidatus Rhodoblastus alkanivorans]MDI4642016.1 type II secretion system F family protein [Rhodoblastus acidophilus]